MKTNKTATKATTSRAKNYTHEGAVAATITKEQELRRSVLTCMLWEDSFYEEGKPVAERIAELVSKVDPNRVASIAIEAREAQKLRHAPLWVVRAMAKSPEHRALVGNTLARVIQRPDELSEFLALYWKDGKQKLANQVKKGLARAFTKFDGYQLAKYNRDSEIKLRDVMFLTHPKPISKMQGRIWKQLVDGKLASPNTWEVALSSGENKKETFTRLIDEGKLGGLALLRNLRGMIEAGVTDATIRKGLAEMNTTRVLPFRFITAAKYAPRFEKELEEAMIKNLAQAEKLPGKTVLIIDVSGSMSGGLSSKSELNRLDAAKALAMILREVCEEVQIYTTAGHDGDMIHKTELIPARHGFALGEAIDKSEKGLGGGGIFLTQVMDYTLEKEGEAARTIVITDEQDCDRKCNPSTAKAYGDMNYLINIANFKNGIGYKKWVHIDGWSEAVVDYILAFEDLQKNGNLIQ